MVDIVSDCCRISHFLRIGLHSRSVFRCTVSFVDESLPLIVQSLLIFALFLVVVILFLYYKNFDNLSVLEMMCSLPL